MSAVMLQSCPRKVCPTKFPPNGLEVERSRWLGKEGGMTRASRTQSNNHTESDSRESARTAGRCGATMKEPEATDAKWLRMFGEVLRKQGMVHEAILCQHYADKFDLYERHGRISGVLIAVLFFAGLLLAIAYYLK